MLAALKEQLGFVSTCVLYAPMHVQGWRCGEILCTPLGVLDHDCREHCGIISASSYRHGLETLSHGS